MPRIGRENLDRLLGELGTLHASSPGPSGRTALAARRGLCKRLAEAMPLSHATAPGHLASICESGLLLSLRELDVRGLRPLDSANPPVEVGLGTDNDVFLFAGPFRFPGTECGFLFKPSLEEARKNDAVASPFDSGGLVDHHRPPNGELPADFLRRHELPVPEYREYLEMSLDRLFEDPWHYLDGTGPTREGPVQLVFTATDARRWTSEVRVEREVAIRDVHLKAVFLSVSAGKQKAVQQMIYWCRHNEVDIVPYRSPRGASNLSFREMKARCIEYIRKML